MISFKEFAACDAHTIAARVQSGEFSPVEIVETALAALERLEPLLHAFSTPTPEYALRAAKALETRLARGERRRSARWRSRVAVKDLILTRGIRTTFGSRLYENYVPEVDDIAVERLKTADAIIIGKTNAVRIRLWRLRPQSAVSHDTESLESRADARRFERRLRSGDGRRRLSRRARQRRRRFGAPARRLHRPRRRQADDGPHPPLAGMPRRGAARRLRLGVDRALRPSLAFRARRGALSCAQRAAPTCAIACLCPTRASTGSPRRRRRFPAA